MWWPNDRICGALLYSSRLLDSEGLDLSTGIYGLAIVAGTLIWIAMARCGRRTLCIAGCALYFTTLVAAGIVGCLK